mgnify:FL=1
MNVGKTKVMFLFRKSGLLSMNIFLEYNGVMVELVNGINGIVFTAGCSFNQTQITLAGQSKKASLKMYNYKTQIIIS